MKQFIKIWLVPFIVGLALFFSILLFGQDTPPTPPGITRIPSEHLKPHNEDPLWNTPKGQDTIHTTNSSTSYHKPKIVAYRKECPDCGAMLTSTNFTTTTVPGIRRMTVVVFACPTCDEVYTETITKEFKKTPVVEVKE